MSLQRVDYLFSDNKGHFAFGSIMFKNRYKFLLSHIRFDDYSDPEKNWSFAAMRPVWELFNKNLGKYIAPRQYQTIDEAFYPMRHQIAFLQYNPTNLTNMGFYSNHWMTAFNAFIPIDSSKTEVLLGITIDHELKFDDHVNRLCKKASLKLNALARIAPFMNVSKKRITYM